MVRLLPYGGSALLVELDSVDRVRAVYAALTAAREAGRLVDVVELVPAARTVLVAVRPGPVGATSERLAAVRAELESAALDAVPAAVGRSVTVPVSYDGADLELVASTAGLSTAAVVALHTSAEYAVAFCGFAPGFGYLTGLPEQLRQPRLETARPTVLAGAVGIADEFTGVYPRASPGGWRLIGRTTLTMFDPDANPPATLAPGDRVRFEVT